MTAPLHPYRTLQRDLPDGWDGFTPSGLILDRYGAGFINNDIACLLHPASHQWRLYKVNRGVLQTPHVGPEFDDGWAAMAYGLMLTTQ